MQYSNSEHTRDNWQQFVLSITHKPAAMPAKQSVVSKIVHKLLRVERGSNG